MKAFETTSANVIGTFPSTLAKQSSGAGSTDGTPLHSDYFNNFWGWVQDLLNRAGLTPSGVLEASTAETGVLPLGTTATQIRTAFQLGAMEMPGKIVLWARSQSPATVGARVLLLQGQTIAIASYKDLVAACYCGDSVNNTAGVPFYKSSDSGGVTRSTSGTWFTLPDFRGVTIRGVDTGNTRDPLGSTRGGGTPNGSVELDAIQGHLHLPGPGDGDFVYVHSAGSGLSLAGASAGFDRFGATGSPTSDGSNGSPRISSETRMVNGACFIGITY